MLLLDLPNKYALVIYMLFTPTNINLLVRISCSNSYHELFFPRVAEIEDI